MPDPVLRVPALTPFLRCPDQRCRQAWTNAETEERIRGTLRCARSACRQRWFVEPLEAGDVRAQLQARYCDAGITDDVMTRFRLPEWIDTPMYFQTPVSSELWSNYINARETAATPRARTIALMRSVLASFHRR